MATRRVPQGIDGIACLGEEDIGESPEIEPGLNQARVPNHHLNASPQLPLVPAFAQLRRYFCRQYGNTDSFPHQDLFQTPGHIPLLRVNCAASESPSRA